MTTPVPADPSLDAPSLIGTGVQSLVTEARRLGLNWQLVLATVTDPAGPSVVCDGDSENIIVTSMIGPLRVGMRVFIIQVPPSGNYVAGAVDIDTLPGTIVGEGYATTIGTVATSNGPEVAVPVSSWNVEPSATFQSGRLYKVNLQLGAFPSTATDSVTRVRLRKGSATTAGTLLWTWWIELGTGAATAAPTCNLLGYVKNTTTDTVVTKLTVSNERRLGAASTSLFMGSVAPLVGILTVTDIGPVDSFPSIAAVAVSV